MRLAFTICSINSIYYVLANLFDDIENYVNCIVDYFAKYFTLSVNIQKTEKYYHVCKYTIDKLRLC